MINSVFDFLRRQVWATATFRQSGVTFAGTALNGVLAAAFYILTARILGPSDFGVLMVAITTLSLLASIGDMGTETGLVRFVSKHLKADTGLAWKFLRLSLETKVIVAVAIVALGYLFSPAVAAHVFAKPELAKPLFLAFIGASGYVLFSFATSYFQAAQKFWLFSGLQVFVSAIRLVVILVLIYFGTLTLENTLTAYIIFPFIGFAAGFLFLPWDFVKTGSGGVRSEFFHYNKWVALFTLVAALADRVDTFISARLLSLAEVGYYSAASQLVVIIIHLVSALGVVFAPKFSSFTNRAEFVSYFKKAQLMVAGISIGGLAFSPVILLAIPIIWPEYGARVPGLFLILLVARLFFLLAMPVHNSILYYFSYPRFFVYLSFLQLLTTLVFGWILISAYQATGAALTVLVSMLIGFLVPAAWLYIKLKKS